MGLGVIALTYETEEKHLKFTKQYNIGYTILSDPESKYIKALGILNTEYDSDSMAYGVPYPGIFLVDAKGIVRAKFAEEGYRARPLLDDVLSTAGEILK